MPPAVVDLRLLVHPPQFESVWADNVAGRTCHLKTYTILIHPLRYLPNIFILAKHDGKRLARRAGKVTCEGFNYSSKANNLVWPYPCPRPSFKTAWLYRTACLNSIQTVAMQLRILWVCLRWDDMQMKSLSTDGKYFERWFLRLEWLWHKLYKYFF